MIIVDTGEFNYSKKSLRSTLLVFRVLYFFRFLAIVVYLGCDCKFLIITVKFNFNVMVLHKYVRKQCSGKDITEVSEVKKRNKVLLQERRKRLINYWDRSKIYVITDVRQTRRDSSTMLHSTSKISVLL